MIAAADGGAAKDVAVGSTVAGSRVAEVGAAGGVTGAALLRLDDTALGNPMAGAVEGAAGPAAVGADHGPALPRLNGRAWRPEGRAGVISLSALNGRPDESTT